MGKKASQLAIAIIPHYNYLKHFIIPQGSGPIMESPVHIACSVYVQFHPFSPHSRYCILLCSLCLRSQYIL